MLQCLILISLSTSCQTPVEENVVIDNSVEGLETIVFNMEEGVEIVNELYNIDPTGILKIKNEYKSGVYITKCFYSIKSSSNLIPICNNIYGECDKTERSIYDLESTTENNGKEKI